MREFKANRYQRRFFLEWQLAPDSTLYNTPLVYRVHAGLDVVALEAALSYFVNQYYAGCRSCFRLDEENLLQRVLDPLDTVLLQQDVAAGTSMTLAIAKQLAIPFDLHSGPLFRFVLLHQGDAQVLLLNFHHIIADATSALQFVEVLQQSYRHFTEGTALPQPASLEQPLDDASSEADIDYWCQQLAGHPLGVELPQQEVAAVAVGLGGSHYFKLDAEVAQALRKYARSQGATPFMLISAAVAHTVAGYAGAESLVLNYPVDMRPAGARQVLGCFINNYPLLLTIDAQSTLQTQVAALRQQRKAAREFGRFTLTEVIRQLRQRSLSEERPFNVSVVEAYFGEGQLILGDARLEPLPLGERQVVGDLVFAYQLEADCIRLRLDYQLARFTPAFVERLAGSLTALIERALEQPEHPIQACWLLTPEVHRQLQAFAGTRGLAQGQHGVMAMFIATLERQPDAPALHYGHATLSYRQLASAASALAEQLGRDGQQRRIGLYLQRKDLAVVAILAILGSGNAYVPIDPCMPLERLRDIVSDSGMDLLLCDQALPIDVRQLCLAPSLLRAPVGPVHLVPSNASALAYLMYTSGSTGKPKGVRIEHGSLGHLVADFVEALQLDPHDRVVGATAIGFDIFGLELFCALASGARLLLLDNEVRDPSALCAALDAYQPTLLQGTPSFWSILALARWRPASRDQARLLCGGEALSKELADYLLSCSTQVMQVYGPTETTIWSTRKVLSEASQYAVIGQPIGATCCYVLDNQQQPLPWGASGELYLGGVGVSSGYHQRETLNAERFACLDPLRLQGPSQRLYRSGDRVRWNEQGELVYLGRLDFQVKVRGHRVELGEIEHALHQLPGIRQAVVLAWDQQGQSELAAYVVASDPASADPGRWRELLRRHLPGHMVPRYIQCLAHLPRSLNGKVDRQALERPPLEQASQGRAPSGALEASLAELWQAVLKGPAVSADVSFFDLGGHSLLAAQLMIAINQRFGVRLSLAELLRYPSVHELAAHLAGLSAESPAPLQHQARFPLSVEQRHLYFSDRYDPSQVQRFNLVVVQRLTGELNLPALQRAWAQVVARHEQLQMTVLDDQGLWQALAAQADLALEPITVGAESLLAWLQAQLGAPIALDRAPLYRLQLARLGVREHVLVLRVPHLLADGWSLELLRQQLGDAYNAEIKGATLAWPAPTQHYSTAVARQQEWLQSPAFDQARAYWQQLLEGYAGLDLPRDHGIAAQRSGQGAQCHFSLPAALVERLTRFCEPHNASLFSGLFGVFAVLLQRYCDQPDLVISVPSANRSAGNEQVFGLFACTLPLRVQIDDQQPFATLLAQIARLTLEAQAHQGVPLESIQAQPTPSDGLSHPWMQAVFALQSANEQHSLDLHGLRSEYLEVEDGIARYPLFLSMRHDGQGLRATLEYASDRFSAARMLRLGEQFQDVLEQVLEGQAALANLELVGPEARQSLVERIRAAQVTAEPHSLVSVFATIARRYPQAIALQDGLRTQTYAELDRASSAVARRLRRDYRLQHGQTLAADTLVGLCVQRSLELVVGLIGILKAGAAYVPLDPDYPAARLAAVVQDSGLQWVLGTAAALRQSGLSPAHALLLDEEDEADDETLPQLTPEQLAYVIYTSGSTGTPKGAMLSHHNVLRLLRSSERLFDLRQQDTGCLFHSYAFDFSVWELWCTLLQGARLVIVPQDVSRDPEAFRALLLEQQVTVLNQTPGAFVRLLGEDCRHPQRLALREVIFGGEALDVAALAPWFGKYADSVRLSNMYGITETTVHVTHKVVTSEDLARPACNDIGRPLADLQVLVLDRHARLCPVGVTGELYIAGPGLARGYLNQPELTQQAFVHWHGVRLYRTGDLGRWLDNGHLEYQGRNDRQVKLRGFRIELGDIQAALLAHPQIDNALVLHDREREQLHAWFCAAEPLALTDLHAHLRQRLPAFMLPQRLQQVASFPLTANGKVDVGALRALQSPQQVAAAERRAPTTPGERLLAGIWQQVLEIAEPVVDDDFFSCGGDSLRVLEVQRLARQAGYTFSPRQLFLNPTLAALASALEPFGADSTVPAVMPFSLVDHARAEHCRAAGDEDCYPLTALQEGMLFHSQLPGGTSTYLDLMSCRVKGPFNAQRFSEALAGLMQRHGVLRTLFVQDGQGGWQHVRTDLGVPLQVHALDGLDAAQCEDALQQFFDAQLRLAFTDAAAPLWRMAVHCLGSAFHLTLSCHHAILDGWSVANLFTELLSDYDQLLGGSRPQHGPSRLSFADYVAQERHWREDPELAAFWQQAGADQEPTLLAEPAIPSLGQQVGRWPVPISTALDGALRSTAKNLGVSLDLLLLAAHLQALGRFTGRRRVVCGMPSHGRLSEDAGQRMLGLFLNSVPCAIDLKANETPEQLIERLRQLKAELDGRANYPLREIQRALGGGALFDSLFNFVNFRVFEQLNGLQHLDVQPGYCYEETNFTLVNQTGIDPATGALRVELVHRQAVFSEACAQRFALFYQAALSALAQVPLGIEQQAALQALYPPRQWLGHATRPAADVGLAQRFAQMCAEGPERTALIDQHQRLSYRQLDRWSTAIAQALLQQHGAPLSGQRIAVQAVHGPATIAALLAVVKLGAAYVPLDPAYPAKRLRQLLDDAQPAAVLGEPFDEQWPALSIAPCPPADTRLAPLPLPDPAQLAYVMYTSGSTGEPKGVMVEQAGILRLVLDTNYVQINPGDVLAQLASLSFDAATFEIWGALLNGATLSLPPSDSLLDSTRLERYLLGERVDVLFMTTRLFDRHVGAGHAAMFRGLRYLLIGGEVMDPVSMATLLNCPQGRPEYLLNCYGPTENTTFSTVHRIDPSSLQLDDTPIGWPIDQTQVYVLDELQREVPVGQVGELYLGGAGLARGYLGNDSRSAQAFVELQMSDADDPLPRRRRLYRTGDAVRWLTSGELRFVGRIDRTVKVNGYRVNLGELEAAARLCAGVTQCVALNRQGLTLYFTGSITPQALRQAMGEHLPTFMLPARLLALDSFALNRNGKLDTTRLPEPATLAVDQPPIGEPTQQRLFEIWQRLLGHGQIGIQDNFFERGGDSLLAMQLQQAISEAFARQIAVVDVFRYPSLESMARYLSSPLPADTGVPDDHQQRAAALRARRSALKAH